MRVVATLACRLESTRLYGKPMQLMTTRPIIWHQVDRLRTVGRLDEIVLAISEGPGRTAFIEFAEREGLRYVVGSEPDVLGRMIQAAEMAEATTVLRVCTENPFLYTENLDELIERHHARENDLTVTEKLPLGCHVEIVRLDALRTAHRDGDPQHREHATMFLNQNPDRFRIDKVTPPEALQRPDYRLTVDNPEDLIVVRKVHDALGGEERRLSLAEIIAWLDAFPEVRALNDFAEARYAYR